MEFKKAIQKRRSIRNLTDKIDISEAQLMDVIKHQLKHTPSAFNSQSQKVMLLLNDKHRDFWSLVMEALKDKVPEDKFKTTEDKINGFKAGFGTILFFDDENITKGLIKKFPLYEANILLWAQQHNGMLQGNLWTALAEQNIGASLQHYTEVIDKVARETFDIPDGWKMLAQMPFGGINETVKEKQFNDLSERMIIKK